MRTWQLGKTGLEVSEVGWGGAGVTLYGGVSDDQVFQTLDRALELGVTYWDTA
jgi:aryl-alcohol dehydrogenase-like predicted oxidoreductase